VDDFEKFEKILNDIGIYVKKPKKLKNPKRRYIKVTKPLKPKKVRPVCSIPISKNVTKLKKIREEITKDEPCTCSIQLLMCKGCQCGALQKEKEKNKKF
jgi:hypothetical protein